MTQTPAVSSSPFHPGGAPRAGWPDSDHGGVGEHPECPQPRRGPPKFPTSARFPDVALPVPAWVQRGGRAPGMAGSGTAPAVVVPPCPVHWRLPR